VTVALAPRFLLGTSWKMTKTLAEAEAYVEELAELEVPAGLQLFVLPAHTALARVRDRLSPGSGIVLGAQNAHWADEGAFTGEVSMRMARDAGAELVEIGHSERRSLFGETDETVAAKVQAALAHGLTPLVCVGEPRAVRDAGGAEAFVVAQVRAALSRVPQDAEARVVVAYEPVWSIGVGGTPATPVDVAAVVTAVREVLGRERPSLTLAVLYGGSVDENNAAELVEQVDLDGLFVGRAAWEAAGLARLSAICAVAVRQTTDGRDIPEHPSGQARVLYIDRTDERTDREEL
jgi:triosephosphate isomerase